MDALTDVPGRITTLEELSAYFRPPAERVMKKALGAINVVMASFIEHVSFMVLATSDGAGSVDASPRGGPAGFLQLLDERHIAIPDLVGNNRIDSYRNLVQHPYAGLLLIVPGRDETLRLNGPATLSTDPELLAGFKKELRAPKVAVVVEVAEVYGHCAKAFKRGQVWQPDAWTATDVPDLVAMYSCEWDLGDPDALRTAMKQNLANDLASDLADNNDVED